MAYRRAFLRAVVLLIGAIALPATLTANANVPAPVVEPPHPSASAAPPPVRAVAFADRSSADEPDDDHPGFCELASARGFLVDHPEAVWVWDGAFVVLMDRSRVVARCGPGTQHLWTVGPPFTVWAPTPGYLLPPSIPVPSPGCQWWQTNCENGIDRCSVPPADCATVAAYCAYPVGCPSGIQATPPAPTSPDPATTDPSSSTDTSDPTVGQPLPVPDGRPVPSGPRETPRSRPTEKLTPLDPAKPGDPKGAPESALPRLPEVTLEPTAPGRQALPEATRPDVTDTVPGVTGTRPDVSGSSPDVTGSRPDVSGSSPDVTGSGPDVSGSSPDLSGSSPDLSGSLPEVSGSSPDLGGSSPDVSGSSPNVIDTNPGSSPNITDPGGGMSGSSPDSSGSGGISPGTSGPLIPSG